MRITFTSFKMDLLLNPELTMSSCTLEESFPEWSKLSKFSELKTKKWPTLRRVCCSHQFCPDVMTLVLEEPETGEASTSAPPRPPGTEGEEKSIVVSVVKSGLTTRRTVVSSAVRRRKTSEATSVVSHTSDAHEIKEMQKHIEENSVKPTSMLKIFKTNKGNWHFFFLGLLGCIISGIVPPFFALVYSQIFQVCRNIQIPLQRFYFFRYSVNPSKR